MSDQVIVQRPLEMGALNTLRERAERVLTEARRHGATGAEVGVSLSQGLSVTVRMGDVETLEFHRDRGISLTVYFGQRKGSASSGDDSDDSIREMVKAACAIAEHTGEDVAAGIAVAEQMCATVPDLDLYHPWAISPEEAIADALRCEQAGRVDVRIVNSEGASVSSGDSLRWYANSNGFSAGYPTSSHSRSCVLVAEQDGAMQRDYWYDSGCRADQLGDAESVGRKAAQRTLSRLGAQRPKTGKFPVLFAPEVASGLLGHFIGAISGGSLYRNATFLKGKLGEALFPEWVTLAENPLLLGGSGSAPFDHDGLATRAQNFVEQGVLASYAVGLYASRRLAIAPTGNGGGVRNLKISDSGEDQAALLRKMHTGVLISEAMGPGVNLVSGDYSRGAAGFWVENGEIQYPIEEFTIAGHLSDMYKNLAGSGTDIDDRGNVHVGSLLLSEMNVAGS